MILPVTYILRLYPQSGFAFRLTIPKTAIYLGAWAYTMVNDKKQRVAALEVGLYFRITLEWIIE